MIVNDQAVVRRERKNDVNHRQLKQTACPCPTPSGAGETSGLVDEQRLANMKKLTELTDQLLGEIDDTVHSADRVKASMKAIGIHARDFMATVKDV